MRFSFADAHRAAILTGMVFLISPLGPAGNLSAQSQSDNQAAPPAAAIACMTCHGQEGNSINPLWPSLAGQKPVYLANQIISYRDGVRKNPVMEPLVSHLSDQDVDELAEWYGGQTPAAHPSGTSEQANRGQQLAAYCIGCHGLGGITVNPEWPNLAGQHAPYQVQQLKAFQSGERYNASMTPIISAMTEADFEALAAYYSQRPQ